MHHCLILRDDADRAVHLQNRSLHFGQVFDAMLAHRLKNIRFGDMLVANVLEHKLAVVDQQGRRSLEHITGQGKPLS